MIVVRALALLVAVGCSSSIGIADDQPLAMTERDRRGVDLGVLVRGLLQKSASISSVKVNATKNLLTAKAVAKGQPPPRPSNQSRQRPLPVAPPLPIYQSGVGPVRSGKFGGFFGGNYGPPPFYSNNKNGYINFDYADYDFGSPIPTSPQPRRRPRIKQTTTRATTTTTTTTSTTTRRPVTKTPKRKPQRNKVVAPVKPPIANAFNYPINRFANTPQPFNQLYRYYQQNGGIQPSSNADGYYYYPAPQPQPQPQPQPLPPQRPVIAVARKNKNNNKNRGQVPQPPPPPPAAPPLIRDNDVYQYAQPFDTSYDPAAAPAAAADDDDAGANNNDNGESSDYSDAASSDDADSDDNVGNDDVGNDDNEDDSDTFQPDDNSDTNDGGDVNDGQNSDGASDPNTDDNSASNDIVNGDDPASNPIPAPPYPFQYYPNVGQNLRRFDGGGGSGSGVGQAPYNPPDSRSYYGSAAFRSQFADYQTTYDGFYSQPERAQGQYFS